MEIRHLLAQHAVGADDFGPAPAPFALLGAIDHEKVVEDVIVGVLVAPREDGKRVRRGRHLFVEYFVAEPLGAPDLALLAGEPTSSEPIRP